MQLTSGPYGKPLLLSLLYLGFLTMTSYPFYYTSVQWHQGQPVAVNHCYIFLQFIVAIFVSVITAFMFEETFRENHYRSLSPFRLT